MHTHTHTYVQKMFAVGFVHPHRTQLMPTSAAPFTSKSESLQFYVILSLYTHKAKTILNIFWVVVFVHPRILAGDGLLHSVCVFVCVCASDTMFVQIFINRKLCCSGYFARVLLLVIVTCRCGNNSYIGRFSQIAMHIFSVLLVCI